MGEGDRKKTFTLMFDSPRDCYTVAVGVGTTLHTAIMQDAMGDFEQAFHRTSNQRERFLA
jgi:hypothetical protein